MHPRDIAGAAPDDRKLPFADELDLVVGGAWPVEPAISQDCAVSPEDHVLDVADRLHHRVRRRPRVQVQRVLLGLHPPALADSVPGGVALRDEVGDAGRLGRGQQVIRPLDAQPIGGGEPPIQVPEIGLAGVSGTDRGHLVHDRVRPGLGHRLTNRRRVQPVHHDGTGAQLLQQAHLGRARRRSRHPVAPGHELRHQPPPQDPSPACHEYPHNDHLPDSGICL